jgi:hypothetical protein
VSRNESYCEPNILLHSCFGRWSGREWVLEAALSAVQAIALSLGLDHQRGEGAGAIGSSRARLGLQSCLDSNGLDTVREQVEFGGVVHEAWLIVRLLDFTAFWLGQTCTPSLPLLHCRERRSTRQRFGTRV